MVLWNSTGNIEYNKHAGQIVVEKTQCRMQKQVGSTRRCGGQLKVSRETEEQEAGCKKSDQSKYNLLMNSGPCK